MKKVVIIDYQLGNLFSVRQALQNIGLNAVISSSPYELEEADAAVLPGVGAFADAIKNLDGSGMSAAIHQHIDAGKPFMGVCLGLQLLFGESEEFGSTKGLNVLPGKVRKFSKINAEGAIVRVPQIAWNEIYRGSIDWKATPLEGLSNNEHMYFVHSYYVEPEHSDVVLSRTTYGNKEYTSSVYKNNIFACQFHPEKSADMGLAIYKNWALQNKLIEN